MSEQPMQANRSAMIRWDFREQHDKGLPHPRDTWREWAPTATRRMWIPQTIGDQIWMLYEFADGAARDAFVEGLADDMKARCAIWDDQAFYDHWTGAE